MHVCEIHVYIYSTCLVFNQNTKKNYKYSIEKNPVKELQYLENIMKYKYE